ncbi:hypothetical protein G6F57_021352 [Rhizopus arrhizus]|nr:hypothetical protein G6F57_021352 [Rhizopus arrhizus]
MSSLAAFFPSTFCCLRSVTWTFGLAPSTVTSIATNGRPGLTAWPAGATVSSARVAETPLADAMPITRLMLSGASAR